MSHVTIWRMTLAENAVVPEEKQSESFDFTATMQGNAFCLSLAGCLDTITAPEVLSTFDKIEAEQTVSAISVDCGKLDYISAAGLRVLLIMANKHPGALSLSQVNKTVTEILEQSRFIDLLEIKA